jgi:3-oxoacyl-[acyl-carrier protein] reductase
MKIALITGGSRGIGRATAIQLAKDGYYVIVNFNGNESAANDTLNKILDLGGKGEILKFDVKSFEETTSAIQEWETKNENYISVLVNNAGIIEDSVFAMMAPDKWDRVLKTNLYSFYNVTQAVIKKMMRNKNGCIVNVSSLAGTTGIAGQTNYAASKFGLIGATKSLAVELAKKNIRVNAVAPGYIKSDMTEGINESELIKTIPMGRFGISEDVAKCISFLVSENSSYITGEVISINGGLNT